MNSDPLVSVLLPTYSRNASGLLARAIQTVLDQTFQDFELIVVDDGSTDGSADTIRSFASRDPRIRHLRFETNVGLPALTTAKAFEMARGQYVAWQFDDCEWYPHHLKTLLDVALSHRHAGVFYGQADMNVGNSSILMGEKCDPETLRYRNPVPNVATLTHRDVFTSIGWFDPHVILKRINDYDFWVRASVKFDFTFIPKSLACEDGCNLQDSLGNSVSLFSDVARVYMSEDRNLYLAISNRESWDPFRIPQSSSARDKDRYLLAIFEHFVRVGNTQLGADRICSSLALCDEGQPEREKIARAIQWYAQAIKDTCAVEEPKFIGYQRYIANVFRIHGMQGFKIVWAAIIRLLKRRLSSTRVTI